MPALQSKIYRFDIVEIADEAEDLARVIRIVGVVFQGVNCGVVDVEQPSLDHIDDRALSNGLDTGDLSVRGRDHNGTGLNASHRNVLRVVDGKAAADFSTRRRRLRRAEGRR